MKIKLLVHTVVLFFLTTLSMHAQQIIEVNSPDVKTLLQKNPQLVILDVRTPGEFAQGHIKDALLIDANGADAVDKINKLDKNAKYMVYCRTKNRSGVVANYMIQNGFKTVYQMMDGITGWNLNSLPVEK